jgi:hypothetical protein
MRKGSCAACKEGGRDKEEMIETARAAIDVAYHEAAHAVAAFRAGGLPSITLHATADYLGKTSSDGLDDLDDRTYVRVVLAGPAMDYERGLRDVRELAWVDFENAEEFITRNGWDVAPLLAEARAWVRSETDAITIVAERLLIEQRLNDNEVAILIGAADGDDLGVPLEDLLRLHRQKRDDT